MNNVFLITGAGRSGSTYITKALQHCGLDVGHHKMGKDGIVCSFYCFEAKRYPTRMPAPRPHFDVILHQVREPLKSIASMQTGRSWQWTCQFMPVGVDAPLLKRCCYNWLVFNEHAERQAVLTYRIEALRDVWADLRRLLGFDAQYERIMKIPHTVNTRVHDAVTWRDIKQAAPEIYDAIRAAAQRYGYEV